MKDCIFCKIVAGEIPSYKIWEDEHHLAILDAFPEMRGMTLVIPKDHVPSYLLEVDNEVMTKILDVAREVAKILDSKLEDSIRTTFLFEGIDVDHLHAKLLPFYKDRLNGEHPKKADDRELARLSQYLRS